MIHIGINGDHLVFEPTNRWLNSTEDGLRYHRSMDETDVYDGPLEMATFGRAVEGPLSADRQWMISPIAYDPIRPPINVAQTGGNLPTTAVAAQSLATPTSEARTLGDYTAPTTT